MSRAASRSTRPDVRYRPARRSDVDACAELGARAYRVASVEQRRQHYLEHPRFSLRDVRVVELDGAVVGLLILYPLHAYVRGEVVPITGVGSVAVSPEHRRRGIGEALMRAALQEMHARGDRFSALYAYRSSWYRPFGWGAFEYVHQLAIPPALLPASDQSSRVRRVRAADRPAVQALYDRVARNGHFALARTPAWWRDRLWDYPGEWILYAGRRGAIEGFLHYDSEATKGPFRLAMTVSEFVAASPEAHRGLVGHLASLRDQYEELHIAVPGDAAWLTLCRNPHNLHPGSEIGAYHDAGNVAQGARLRLVDVKGALETLPIAPDARGEIVLEVSDPVLVANTGAWRVVARDGGLQITEAGRSRAPRLSTTVEALAGIVAGTVPPIRAAEAGIVDGSDAATVIESWFRTRPAFLHQLNAF